MDMEKSPQRKNVISQQDYVLGYQKDFTQAEQEAERHQQAQQIWLDRQAKMQKNAEGGEGTK